MRILHILDRQYEDQDLENRTKRKRNQHLFVIMDGYINIGIPTIQIPNKVNSRVASRRKSPPAVLFLSKYDRDAKPYRIILRNIALLTRAIRHEPAPRGIIKSAASRASLVLSNL